VVTIMKDSRVGAFGAMGIALLLGLKAVTLARVPAGLMVATLVAGHAASRWAAATLLFTHKYVREEADAKAKPMATQLSVGALGVATLFGLAPLALLPVRIWGSLGTVIVARWWLGRWFYRRIGGYTGDCLGAAQQVCEVAFYLTVVALTWR
jgi:adenosylcobinamide-GDP ribazoletransferase